MMDDKDDELLLPEPVDEAPAEPIEVEDTAVEPTGDEDDEAVAYEQLLADLAEAREDGTVIDYMPVDELKELLRDA